MLFWENLIVFFLCNNVFSLQFGMVASISVTFPIELYGKDVGTLLMADCQAMTLFIVSIFVWTFDKAFTIVGMTSVNLTFVVFNILIIIFLARNLK